MDREEIQEQIERERERRVAFAREAGKAGAASPLHRQCPDKAEYGRTEKARTAAQAHAGGGVSAPMNGTVKYAKLENAHF